MALLRISDCARELDLHPATIQRMIRARRIPVYRFSSKSVRVDIDELKRIFREDAENGEEQNSL